MKSLLCIMALVAHAIWALDNCPTICVTDPLLQLEAGTSNVSATIGNTFETQCTATLHFADPEFLSVTYRFGVADCRGLEVAFFTIPLESPNGDACIVWCGYQSAISLSKELLIDIRQCAGQEALACNSAVISAGQSNFNMETTKNGTVGCISQAVSTHTALVTVTTASRTMTTVSTSLLTTLITSIATFGDGGTFQESVTTLTTSSTAVTNTDGVLTASMTTPTAESTTALTTASTTTSVTIGNTDGTLLVSTANPLTITTLVEDGGTIATSTTGTWMVYTTSGVNANIDSSQTQVTQDSTFQTGPSLRSPTQSSPGKQTSATNSQGSPASEATSTSQAAITTASLVAASIATTVTFMETVTSVLSAVCGSKTSV